MKIYGKKYVMNCFVFVQVILFLCMVIYQTSLFGDITPGVYDVIIKVDPIEEMVDTWTFSKNGTFESKSLGESTWEEDTSSDTFKINADKSKIKKALEKNFKLLGLKTSDISISIKKLEISGTSETSSGPLGNSTLIEGKIKTDIQVKIKRPLKTSFTTSGNTNFEGTWYKSK